MSREIVDKETDKYYAIRVDNLRSSRKPVSDLQVHLGFWLRFVSNHVSQAFARKLFNTGVTVAEWVVLRQLFGRDEMAPSELAEITGLTRGAASKLIDRLVTKDLATREERQDDRRFQVVGLTPAGQHLVPRLAAMADENDEQFFEPLSTAEREKLMELLRKLVAAHKLNKLPIE